MRLRSSSDSPATGKEAWNFRTDGLVVRNVLFKGALEHGFYTEETDGVLLDKVKFFWNADYGHLSFTTDHNVIQNCEAFGSGDATRESGKLAQVSSDGAPGPALTAGPGAFFSSTHFSSTVAPTASNGSGTRCRRHVSVRTTLPVF